MPYVDLYSSDDYAALWYTTNTPYNNVGGFDPSKPSIMILHPMFLCSKWLDNQFGDFRLDYGYNLIAFDMRVAGKSVCRPSGKHDSWVDAADLAFAARVSHLPPRRSRDPHDVTFAVASPSPGPRSRPREHLDALCNAIRPIVRLPLGNR